MDEANRPKIADPIRAFFLGKESNVCGIQPMEFFGIKFAKEVDNSDDVNFDDVPTFLEERTRETIRVGCLVTWHVVDRIFDLLLGEWFTKTLKVNLLKL